MRHGNWIPKFQEFGTYLRLLFFVLVPTVNVFDERIRKFWPTPAGFG